MKRFPEASTATAAGWHSDAEVACPPSPEKPDFPLPATVVITPFGEILRIRWLNESAMKRFPEASGTTAARLLKDAAVAGPPSPEDPARPLPATIRKTPWAVI